MNPTQQPQIDKQAVALAKAIRRAESNDNFDARGASGEWGGYQFMPETWAGYAKEAGVNAEFGKATREQQNEVAYKKIKQWKDQGYNPGQIASMWNAGPGRPNAYRENWKGVNSQGVAYDTPAYAEKVARNYQTIKAEMQLLDKSKQPTVATQPEEEKSNLVQDIKDISSNRLTQASEAINRGLSGEQGVLSTILQTAGAGAGGILDTAGSLVKAIPVVGDVVEGAENLLGKGVQKAVETPLGGALVSEYQDFAKENPVAAANIGAGLNIASAIPIVKGISLGFKAPGLIKEGLTPNATKEAAAIKELQDTISRRATGAQAIRGAEKRGLDPVATLVKERLLPEVKPDAKGTTRYDINKVDAQLDDSIDKLDDVLDTMLEQASINLVGQVRLVDVKTAVIKEVKKEFEGSPDLKDILSKIDKDFDSISMSYGRDFVSLNELNRIKREVRKLVKFNTPAMDESVRYHEGQVIMRIIENVGKSQGLGDVRRINQEMANRLEAQRLLRKYVHGKSVADNPGWNSLLGRGTEASLVSGSESIGQAIGAPLVGALGGKLLSNKMRAGKPGAVEKLSRGRQKLQQPAGLRTALISQGSLRGYQDQERNKI